MTCVVDLLPSPPVTPAPPTLLRASPGADPQIFHCDIVPEPAASEPPDIAILRPADDHDARLHIWTGGHREIRRFRVESGQSAVVPAATAQKSYTSVTVRPSEVLLLRQDTPHAGHAGGVEQTTRWFSFLDRKTKEDSNASFHIKVVAQR